MRLDPGFPHSPGETPASFASRLARTNGLASGRDLCKDLGIPFLGLVEGDAKSVARICELTGSQAEPLLREARPREGNRYRVRGQALVVASFVGAAVRICPVCLAEDGRAARGRLGGSLAAYGRTAWTITYLRTCRSHEVAMIDIPGTPRTTLQDFASVVAPWIAQGHGNRPLSRRRAPSSFETYLLDRLEGRAMGCWLDEMPFYAVARTCEMLGAVAVHGRNPRLKRLENDDWVVAGAEGFAAASGGPAALDRFLGDLMATYPGDRATPVGPMAWFGRFHQWLNYVTTDPAYDPIRNVMVRCVAERAPFHPNERMFGKPIPYRKVHSLRSAAHETGLEAKRLRKALDHAGHLAPGHEHLPDHEVLFSAPAVRDMLRQLATALTLTDVASRLAIDWRQAKQLVDAGFINPMDPAVTGTASSWFSPTELDVLLGTLLTGSDTVQEIPANACAVPRAVRRAQCRLADMVELVRSGSLRWVGHLAPGGGLGSVLVDVAEVCARLRRSELAGHTRREAEQCLGIPSSTVNALIEKGLLAVTVQRHPSVPRNILVIAPAELDRFRSRYMRISDVAELLGISLPSVPRILRDRGIEPALSKDEFHATFYERARVEALRDEAS